jgi:hypothetical protein
MEPYPYTRESYYNRGRKDRLEGRKYRAGQYQGWQGRAYKDGWAQALTLEKLAENGFADVPLSQWRLRPNRTPLCLLGCNTPR